MDAYNICMDVRKKEEDESKTQFSEWKTDMQILSGCSLAPITSKTSHTYTQKKNHTIPGCSLIACQSVNILFSLDNTTVRLTQNEWWEIDRIAPKTFFFIMHKIPSNSIEQHCLAAIEIIWTTIIMCNILGKCQCQDSKRMNLLYSLSPFHWYHLIYPVMVIS